MRAMILRKLKSWRDLFPVLAFNEFDGARTSIVSESMRAMILRKVKSWHDLFPVLAFNDDVDSIVPESTRAARLDCIGTEPT